MRFEADRHEKLGDRVWDDSLARETIRVIVEDIERSRLADGTWPMHPLDDEGGTPSAARMPSLTRSASTR